VDALSLFVGVACIGVVCSLVLLANGVLEVRDPSRVVDVSLSTVSPVVLPGFRHTRGKDDFLTRPSALVEFESVHSKKIESGTLDTAGRSDKAFFNDFMVETEDLKDLGTLVRCEGRNTHLRHDLEDTVVDGVAVVVDELLSILAVFDTEWELAN
jgi:hypothetical protein